jgi:peptidoglycan glycosyltransferase
MVSTPAYDPNTAESDWQSLKIAEDSPLLNRAVQGLYPPGSTIKPLTAAAALGEGITNEKEVFKCTGRLELEDGSFIGEYQGEVHNQVNLEQALAESCNVTFGSLGLRLGGKKLGKYFEAFGFPQEIGGEILMTKSHLPDFLKIGQGDLAQASIGQASLLVTPMHMALMASAFANNGNIMKPYLVQKVISPKGITLENTRPEKWRSALDPAMVAIIDSYMEQVVKEGTGTAAAVRGIRVTGKTGTAENASGEDHAWFIGSAQLPERKIAFAIIVENGGSGGRTAAPIARQIIESMYR